MQPDYDQFSSADFLTDDFFVNHQLAPTPQSAAFWNGWCEEHSLEQWLEWHNMGSLAEARGRLSHRTTQDPAAYERANYIRTLLA